MLNFLKLVCHPKSEEVTTDLRRVCAVQFSPFAAQIFGAQGRNAVELALDRTRLWRSGHRLLGRRGRNVRQLRFGWVGDGCTINTLAVNLFCCQRQAEFFTYDACKKAADRVLLPASHLHDCGDRCSLWLFEQTKDLFLLGPTPGRTRGRLFNLGKLLRE